MPDRRYLLVMDGKEATYIKNWEQKHGKDKWIYLLLSPLIWGGLLALIYHSFRLVLAGSLSWHHLWLVLHHRDFWMAWLLLGFFLFSLQGLLWQLAYRKYRDFKRKQANLR